MLVYLVTINCVIDTGVSLAKSSKYFKDLTGSRTVMYEIK